MENVLNLKNKIFDDDNFANAFEYMMSKMVLDKKLPQLKFIYKKHKIVLGRNGLYTIYKPDGKKLINHIHFQETAKYIVNHSKEYALINEIIYFESEMFRHKEKIEFFSQYNNKMKSDILCAKIDSMYDFYYYNKNHLISILKNDNLY